MDLYLTIYFCMIPVIVAISAAVAGYQKASGKIKYAGDMIMPTLILAVIWPGVLAIACVVAPFVALYYAGFFLATRK